MNQSPSIPGRSECMFTSNRKMSRFFAHRNVWWAWACGLPHGRHTSLPSQIPAVQDDPMRPHSHARSPIHDICYCLPPRPIGRGFRVHAHYRGAVELLPRRHKLESQVRGEEREERKGEERWGLGGWVQVKEWWLGVGFVHFVPIQSREPGVGRGERLARICHQSRQGRTTGM